MPNPPLRAYDGSELDEQLRRVENLLKQSQALAAQQQKPLLRFDPPQPFDGSVDAHGTHIGMTVAPTASRGMGLAWVFLTIGLALFMCGAGLSVSVIVSDRPDLWKIAIPAIIVGQLAIVVGLVLQLDRVWEDSRQTLQRLSRVQDEVERIHARTSA